MPVLCVHAHAQRKSNRISKGPDIVECGGLGPSQNENMASSCVRLSLGPSPSGEIGPGTVAGARSRLPFVTTFVLLRRS